VVPGRTDSAFEPSLHQHRPLPWGNAILQGRDKGPKTTPEIQSTACRDKTRARISANSGLFTKNRVNSQIAASAPKAPHAHDGWLIQIGAFDREDEAKQHLSMARLKIRDALATAHPLTERVQQGDKVLYRARFTGFNKETAQAACRWLRRSDTGCIALKDLN
jgi:hypothetical protein